MSATAQTAAAPCGPGEPLRRATATIRDGLAAAHAGDRRATLSIALQQVFLGLVPTVVFVVLVRSVLASHTEAIDFGNAYYIAAYRVLHGGNPYAWTSTELRDGIAFVYPALSAILLAPFALLPRTAASVLATFICIGLAPLTMWVLGVRDWRVYGTTLVWLPVFAAWQTANETILLAFLTALTWRHRDNPLAAGILAAVAISMKPFMWPLELWLLATRRWRAGAMTVIVGIALNLASWALLGFGNIAAYLHDSSVDASFAWHTGYSVAAMAAHLGAGHDVASALTVLASGALAVAVLFVGLGRRRERQALTLTVTLMLVASPLVWSHYFVLLLVPMALERPRMTFIWGLPILMWVCPPSFHVDVWQEGLAWAVCGTMVVALTARARA